LKISSILDLVNRSLVELKKELDFEIEVSGVDYPIFVEERMVMEAIKALVRNASEASDRHQKIEINVFSVNADQFSSKTEKPTEKCVAIEVKDIGKGFSPKMAGSVVEPFVTTHDIGRFGLGLSVARGVCFAHGGWLTISSAENMGTTARMFLPVSNGEQQIDTLS